MIAIGKNKNNTSDPFLSGHGKMIKTKIKKWVISSCHELLNSLFIAIIFNVVGKIAHNIKETTIASGINSFNEL